MIRLVISIYLLLLILQQIYGSPKLTFRGGSCRFSPNYFSNFTFSTANSSINADMQLIKPLRQGLKANLEIQLRLTNSKMHQKLFSYILNICDLVVSFRSTIFKKWFESLLAYGNFMPNCPVAAGRYYVKGWKPDSKLIPSYLYPGDYRLKGYVFYGRYQGKKEDFVVDIEVDAVIS
ncbi:uncharacterized protein LOC133337767 [Musca vetustissima]|uniref:uncharacterized protein LOC133337767 n=1 Tax=Musca vetustissima TaxID=27455 RepID=UPI002AB757AE|nr:uncharacterized protein LOC133337767 [Musca vetustissima]